MLDGYLLPDEAARARLYPSITPVNSFRIILGASLDEPLPLLPDRSFYNRVSRPYDFVEITSHLRERIESRSEAR